NCLVDATLPEKGSDVGREIVAIENGKVLLGQPTIVAARDFPEVVVGIDPHAVTRRLAHEPVCRRPRSPMTTEISDKFGCDSHQADTKVISAPFPNCAPACRASDPSRF